MTSADDYLIIADAIDALPSGLRLALAEGPVDEPACRICDTLNGSDDPDAQTILDFHDVGEHELAEAALGALGKDRRLSRDEEAAGRGYQRKLERLPRTNVARAAVESLAANTMWWRCLYVYLLAGWKP